MRQPGRRTKAWSRRAVREQAVSTRIAGGAELEREILMAQLARPKKRWQCEGIERPCPFFSCRYHLGLDVTDVGGIIEYHPDEELESLGPTCALDVAARGGATLEVVAAALNLNRERVRRIEQKALARFNERLLLATRDDPDARRTTGG